LQRSIWVDGGARRAPPRADDAERTIDQLVMPPSLGGKFTVRAEIRQAVRQQSAVEIR
jgi:hypothetical protein